MQSLFLLTELSDQSFHSDALPPDVTGFQVRKSARGILMDKDKIALINITKKNYHKLPGGGIEGNETPEEGFIREIKEETGADCEILDEAGITLEHRAQHKLLQISYIFFSKVVRIPGGVRFEKEEIEEGANLVWTDPGQIKNIFDHNRPSEYEDHFITKRDWEILKYYQEKISNYAEI